MDSKTSCIFSKTFGNLSLMAPPFWSILPGPSEPATLRCVDVPWPK